MISIFYKRLLYIILWSIVIIALAACDSMTREEKQLTETYGTEVRVVIEDFELRHRSLEAYNDPSIQAELVTKRYLSYMGDIGIDFRYKKEYYSIVTPLSPLDYFRVIEYSSERFKAVGCIRLRDDRMMDTGELADSFIYKACGIYVFVHKDSIWKLAGYLATSAETSRDWNDIPDWLKETIGSFPENFPR